MADADAETKFARVHARLIADDGRAGERVVRFFDRRDFYSVHGADAEYVARTFYKVRRTMRGRRG